MSSSPGTPILYTSLFVSTVWLIVLHVFPISITKVMFPFIILMAFVINAIRTLWTNSKYDLTMVKVLITYCKYAKLVSMVCSIIGTVLALNVSDENLSMLAGCFAVISGLVGIVNEAARDFYFEPQVEKLKEMLP